MIIGNNAGHTINGLGYGSVGLLHESLEVRKISEVFINELKSKGHTIIDCTIDKSKNYLADAVAKANKQHLDYCISHHLNCFNDANANGVEVLIYDLNDKEVFKVAQSICNELVKLGFKNRGVKQRPELYFLRATKAKAILIEYFFLSNHNDVKKYDYNKLAKASARGLIGDAVVNNSNNKYENGTYKHNARVVNINSNEVLNVREERNPDSKIIGTLRSGQIVKVEYCLNNWFSTYCINGNLGYINGSYIDLI